MPTPATTPAETLRRLVTRTDGYARPIYLRHVGWDGRRGIASLVPLVATSHGWLTDAREEVASVLGIPYDRGGLHVKVGRRWPGDLAADWLQPRLRYALGIPVQVLWVPGA